MKKSKQKFMYTEYTNLHMKVNLLHKKRRKINFLQIYCIFDTEETGFIRRRKTMLRKKWVRKSTLNFCTHVGLHSWPNHILIFIKHCKFFTKKQISLKKVFNFDVKVLFEAISIKACRQHHDVSVIGECEWFLF